MKAKLLWSRIEHYVHDAQAKRDMSQVRIVGIDEASVKKGHEYITVAHDLEQKRLLFACAGRDHETLAAFCARPQRPWRRAPAIEHACRDMSSACLKGVTANLPEARISYDRLHVIALANTAMDEVRRSEVRTDAVAQS